MSLKIADIANSAATAAAAAALGISPTLSKKGHQLLFIVLLVNSLLYFKFMIFPFTIAYHYPVYLSNDLPFFPLSLYLPSFLLYFLCISGPSFLQSSRLHTFLLFFFSYLTSFFFSSFFFCFFYLSSFLIFQIKFSPSSYSSQSLQGRNQHLLRRLYCQHPFLLAPRTFLITPHSMIQTLSW